MRSRQLVRNKERRKDVSNGSQENNMEPEIVHPIDSLSVLCDAKAHQDKKDRSMFLSNGMVLKSEISESSKTTVIDANKHTCNLIKQINSDQIKLTRELQLESTLCFTSNGNSSHDSADMTERAISCSKILDFDYLLSDFGIAVPISSADNLFSLNEGDSAYMPCEVLNEATPKDLRKIDIFSIGLIMFAMMTGKLILIQGVDIPSGGEQWQKLRDEGFASLLLEITLYSERLKKVVVRCLSLDPDNRPTAGEILTVLSAVQDHKERILLRKLSSRLNNRVEGAFNFQSMGKERIPLGNFDYNRNKTNSSLSSY